VSVRGARARRERKLYEDSVRASRTGNPFARSPFPQPSPGLKRSVVGVELGVRGHLSGAKLVGQDILQVQASAGVKQGLQRATESNQLRHDDRAFHDWYRFVLSYPPHLVQQYLDKFELGEGALVLDPFCGTGTSLVECQRRGIQGVGIEAHPFTAFAADVKTDWTPDPDGLWAHASKIGESVIQELAEDGLPDSPIERTTGKRRGTPSRTLSEDLAALLLTDSISPRPLHKALTLLDRLNESRDDRFYRHELLALANSVVFQSSNLAFGPEVGLDTVKPDAPVVSPWLEIVNRMSADLGSVATREAPRARVIRGDSREIASILPPRSVDAVITSPPYPNEKDYTRTTRLESVLLGFVQSKAELRSVKRTLVRSNTRSVYVDDTDDKWVENHGEIGRIALEIEARRMALGKTSGFERMYPRVARLYFGGMLRHLASLRNVLKPGARLAYVVGDQASYLRVMIRTGELIADIAKGLGYQADGTDLFRTRLATATRAQLREEVVLLRWSG
jgi:DNA modification methylase